MKIGYCAVTADILHSGHMRFLETCKLMCDWLIVGVMTDRSVKEYKGHKPIMPYKERAEVVRNIKWVDEVVPQYKFQFGLIQLLCIHVDIVFDSTEHKREVLTNAKRMLVKYTKGISSTKIKERIIEQHLNNSKRKKKGRVKRK